MKIETIDDKTVKIVLSRDDMENFRLTYEEMDYQSPATKRVILRLIDEARRESSVDLSRGKLFIEAFPYADGGCILYINTLELARSEAAPKRRKTSFDTPLIYEFADLDALCAAARRLNDRYGHVILKNALYLLGEKYCLSLYTYFKLDDQISRLLNEYGRCFGKGAILSALLQEHAKPLLDRDALQTIGECLC